VTEADPLTAIRRERAARTVDLPAAPGLLGVDVREHVEAYEEDVCAAWGAYTRRTQAWNREVERLAPIRPALADRVAGVAYRATLESRNAALRDARLSLWDALLATGDPLLVWIADDPTGHIHGVHAEVLTVLAEFPCTLDYLDEIAADEGWCGMWGRARSAAVADGVVPGVTS
jgi:hypothetical protein